MYDIGRGLCWALDAVPFAEDRLGFVPDAWQAQLLRSQSRWILLNCCRQSGKSTTTAIVALHQAIYDPGLVLCVSPSLRQSRELFRSLAFSRASSRSYRLRRTTRARASCPMVRGLYHCRVIPTLYAATVPPSL